VEGVDDPTAVAGRVAVEDDASEQRVVRDEEDVSGRRVVISRLPPGKTQPPCPLAKKGEAWRVWKTQRRWQAELLSRTTRPTACGP
jgi:hypothetical protein